MTQTLKPAALLLNIWKMGHKVKLCWMTNGDAGHKYQGGGALAKRRMAEAQKQRRFGVEYTVLDNHDGELMPTLENRLKVIREIRNWKSDIVITHPSNHYHPDHRYTSLLVQILIHGYRSQCSSRYTASSDKSGFFLGQTQQIPDVAVDIDKEADQKLYAASAHESQFFEWLHKAQRDTR